MRATKRPKLTDRQRRCLLMIGNHGLTGSFTEFSAAQTRQTMHQLYKKKLVQWIDNRWLLSRAGHAEWTLLSMDDSSRTA